MLKKKKNMTEIIKFFLYGQFYSVAIRLWIGFKYQMI